MNETLRTIFSIVLGIIITKNAFNVCEDFIIIQV